MVLNLAGDISGIQSSRGYIWYLIMQGLYLVFDQFGALLGNIKQGLYIWCSIVKGAISRIFIFFAYRFSAVSWFCINQKMQIADKIMGKCIFNLGICSVYLYWSCSTGGRSDVICNSGIFGYYTGCPISYQIVNGSKLQFPGLIRKFKKNKSFCKIE